MKHFLLNLLSIVFLLSSMTASALSIEEQETLKVLCSELFQLFQWTPPSGREFRIQAVFNASERDVPKYGGTISIRRAENQFAFSLYKARGFTAKSFSCGFSDHPWAVSPNGTCFHGKGPGTITPFQAFAPSLGNLWKVAGGLTIATGRNVSLNPLRRFFPNAHLTQDKLSLHREDLHLTVYLDPRTCFPASASFISGNISGKIAFTEWNLDAAFKATDFEPRATEKSQVVNADLLMKVMFMPINRALAPSTTFFPNRLLHSGKSCLMPQKGQLPVLVLAGSPAEIGEAHGTLCKKCCSLWLTLF